MAPAFTFINQSVKNLAVYKSDWSPLNVFVVEPLLSKCSVWAPYWMRDINPKDQGNVPSARLGLLVICVMFYFSASSVFKKHNLCSLIDSQNCPKELFVLVMPT